MAREVRTEINEALEQGGLLATGAAMVIDNAIIGFMQGEGGGSMTATID